MDLEWLAAVWVPVGRDGARIQGVGRDGAHGLEVRQDEARGLGVGRDLLIRLKPSRALTSLLWISLISIPDSSPRAYEGVEYSFGDFFGREDSEGLGLLLARGMSWLDRDAILLRSVF